MVVNLLFATGAKLTGKVIDQNGPVPFATVRLSPLGKETLTKSDGSFELENIPSGNYQLEVRSVGYATNVKKIEIQEGEPLFLDIILKVEEIKLTQVVISGTGTEVPIFEAPVIVSSIDQKSFQNTQSMTLADGLSFSPGLRLETNCQNCGFTQLRMNGLDGAYSQILINSRPIFSSLMGVYGLDLIPAAMIDRIEVVRGGGSVLYGGNAIAGTVNVITKDPLDDFFQVGMNQAYVDFEASDRTFTLNGAIVNDDLTTGLNIYGFNRTRDQWDANGDGFSEMTLIENSTFGFNAFYKPGGNSRLELNAFAINEFRRGGNKFELQPHQTDITEQLDHKILGGALSYELFFDDYRQKFSAYASAQSTDRNSYYGGGGRVLEFGDSLTTQDILAINAYGRSEDLSAVGGVRHSAKINSRVELYFGSEYQFNKVTDRMPGYDRIIAQEVGTWGSFGQIEFKPFIGLSVLAGGRYDLVDIDGDYNFSEERFSNDKSLGVFVPRMAVMYDLSETLKLRGAYAQGYRAPQAFDEDLHIETVGGAALFTQLDPDLSTERSNSYTASLNYSKTTDEIQTSIVLEGFYTDLVNPFIVTNQRELPNGVAIATKRNSDGAYVAGVNLEYNSSIKEKWLINVGLTSQIGKYDQEEELWSPNEVNDSNADSVVSTASMLRTPDLYGYFSLTYTPFKKWEFNYSGVYTGSMDVAHVIDPESEYTIIEETRVFLENNVKVSYRVPINAKTQLELFAGMQNILNAYQSDFDRGADRDAGYIYGPARPRTVFFGVKWGME